MKLLKTVVNLHDKKKKLYRFFFSSCLLCLLRKHYILNIWVLNHATNGFISSPHADYGPFSILLAVTGILKSVSGHCSVHSINTFSIGYIALTCSVQMIYRIHDCCPDHSQPRISTIWTVNPQL